MELNYFGVFDRGIGTPPVDQGGHEVKLNAEDTFGHNFRGVASIDYLSSFVFRLAFNDVFRLMAWMFVAALVMVMPRARAAARSA